jgi:hypothetical protein
MSDMPSSSSSSGGISFSGLLQILFIGLKLAGYINWPWWQVLLPTWIGLGFVAIFLIIFAILAVYSSFFDN